jgi:hypothetical protein
LWYHDNFVCRTAATIGGSLIYSELKDSTPKTGLECKGSFTQTESGKNKQSTTRQPELVVDKLEDGTYTYQVESVKPLPAVIVQPGSETGRADPDSIIIDTTLGHAQWNVDVQTTVAYPGYQLRVTAEC